MADRTVKVSLILQAQSYLQGMDEAGRKTTELGSKTEKLAQQQQSFQTLGTAALGFGATLTAVTGLAVKAATDWESSWAGVTKTVDGTAEELSAVEEGLRELTGVLPATHSEIAGVAEAAGQLGVQTGNVVAFTKTMIDLGETTNLSADQAATSLARFMNVMGTSQDQVSNLGSALVGLGNNYATTESEILEMSMRLAGAGRQIGLTEGETLGLATALSSVGIEAEAGGSAMSKVMIDMAASVEEGGERLEMFASTAGISAQAFADQWRAAPSEAMALFVKGLANAEAQGSSALGVLAELGITEVRMRDALLRSSAAADIFSEAMAQGNSEVEANNALTEEAAKRYETAESKIRIAGNAIKDAAIDFGAVFLPALAAASEAVAGFAGFMGDLPEPLQAAAGIMVAVAGGVALVGGAALLAVPQVALFKTSLTTLGITGAVTRGSLGRMTAFLAGPWGIAMVAAGTVVTGLAAAQEALTTSTEEFQNVLQNADSGKDILAASDNALISQLDLATGSAKSFKTALDQIATNQFLAGVGGSAALRSSLRDIGTELGTLAQSDLPAAQRAFQLLAEEYELNNDEQLQLLDAMGPYKKALIDQANQLGVNVTGMSDAENAQALLNLAMEQAPDASAEADAALAEMQAAAEEADTALQGTAQALADIAGNALTMGEANDAALSALNALTEAAEAEGAALDGTNDASIRLRDSVREVEESHRLSAEAIIQNGGTVAEAAAEWDKGREAVVGMLEAKGMDREEAILWADQQLGSASQVKAGIDEVYRAWLNLPENKETKYAVEAAEAEAKLQALKESLAGIPSYKSITLESFTVGNFDVSIPGTTNATGNYYRGGKVKEFAAGGFASGIYPATSGGIHKFAEAGHDEAFITMDPAHRSRSLDIHAEVGRQLGAFQPAPYSVGASGSAPVERRPINNTQNIYAQPGMSEGQVASIAVDRFDRALREA
ncbi:MULTISPECIES: phage tail tape measure protein [unclassified Microbacterium]|uniref:phage tail tape measure protein n=1 Tax=unclassified Microbacterium TaxID=2609290 RepID=UPI000EA94362|nr:MULTISPECIES: phage tail tape measure protein [unclassified Microbacterium]MBT2485816.1 phage tail tape measure protein [Microbacterium sp. ISL-108]RKN68579.1 phage tail tape measure protein [Microbacterium sp. CGR2]